MSAEILLAILSLLIGLIGLAVALVSYSRVNRVTEKHNLTIDYLQQKAKRNGWK